MIFVCLIFSDFFKFASLITSYVPGTVLGTGDIVISKTDIVPALLGKTINKYKYLLTRCDKCQEEFLLAEKTLDGTDCRGG